MMWAVAAWIAGKAGGVWNRIASLIGWLFATPLRLAVTVAVLALALAGWQYREAQNWSAVAHHMQVAFDAERKTALAVKLAAEAKSRKDAADADRNHDALVAEGDARLAAYMASHRVRIAPATSPAVAAQDHGAGLPESPAPEKLLADLTISEADLRVCDANYAYARAAFEWAQNFKGE